MATLNLDCGRATERCEVRVGTHVYRALEFVPEQDVIRRTSVYAVEPYFTHYGRVVAAQDYPTSATVTLSVDGSHADDVTDPSKWSLLETMYPVQSRWVASPAYCPVSGDQLLAWNPQDGCADPLVLNPKGDVGFLPASTSSVALFAYKTPANGWVDSDAVSLVNGGTLATNRQWGAECEWLMVNLVGVFDQPRSGDYEMLKIVLGTERTISVQLTGFSSVVLSDSNNNQVTNMMVPLADGMLSAVSLVLVNGFAYLSWTTHAGSEMVSVPMQENIARWTLEFGTGDGMDTELVEAGVWYGLMQGEDLVFGTVLNGAFTIADSGALVPQTGQANQVDSSLPNIAMLSIIPREILGRYNARV